MYNQTIKYYIFFDQFKTNLWFKNVKIYFKKYLQVGRMWFMKTCETNFNVRSIQLLHTQKALLAVGVLELFIYLKKLMTKNFTTSLDLLKLVLYVWNASKLSCL